MIGNALCQSTSSDVHNRAKNQAGFSPWPLFRPHYSLLILKVAIEFEAGCRSHQAKTHIAPALRASGKILTLKDHNVVVQTVAIVQHLIDARLRNWTGGLKKLIRHGRPLPVWITTGSLTAILPFYRN